MRSYKLFVKIVHDKSHIYYELSDQFTFEVPGAKFMSSYRSKYWDGKIRLFKYATGEIYYGLLPYVRKFAEDNNISIVSKIKEQNKPLDKLECAKFCKALNIPKITIRDYQFNAFYHAIQEDRCLLLSPTASGKSAIIYCIARHFISMHKKKVLVIVPTTSLVEQMSKDFADYGYDKPIDKMYGGAKVGDTDIVVTTWQTLSRMPKSFFDGFGAVFGDEAHLFKAVSLTKIMTKLTKNKHYELLETLAEDIFFELFDVK